MFHLGNRYVDLEPVLAALLRDAGLVARIRYAVGSARYILDASVWAVVARGEEDLEGLLENGTGLACGMRATAPGRVLEHVDRDARVQIVTGGPPLAELICGAVVSYTRPSLQAARTNIFSAHTCGRLYWQPPVSFT